MAELQFIPPSLPNLVDAPPQGPGWIHEIKYDGYRTQLIVDGGIARAFTRKGHDWTERYKSIAALAATLPCQSAIIDGELIVQDETGRSDFHSLRAAIQNQPGRLVLMAFDLLHIDQCDLRKEPLERRRAKLRKLLGPNESSRAIHFSECLDDGTALFQLADKPGLEGVVSKKLGSRYRSGHGKGWLKAKCFYEEELSLIGTERGDRAPVALLARETDHGLEYAGCAFITLAQPERDRFWREAEALKASKPALPMKPRKDAFWTRPALRLKVRTLRGEEMLRHATVRSFKSAPFLR